MTWFEDTRRSWYQDRGNLGENYPLKNWFDLIFPHFLLCTDWVCASELRNYFACDPFDFRFRLQEYGPTGIDHRNPTLIICSGLRKESTVDKKERGVENCLLQFIFCLRDFNLASYARVIDIGAIESRSLDAFASFTHRFILWMERFSERKVSTIHANFPSV